MTDTLASGFQGLYPFILAEILRINWAWFAPTLIWLLGILPTFHFFLKCVDAIRPEYNKDNPDRHVSVEQAGQVAATFALIWPLTLILLVFWFIQGVIRAMRS